MKIDSKPLRYAHAEGHTDICYSDDGKHIVTCGHDGDVRIWIDIEDDDPNSHCVGENAVAVCFKDRRLYVATDNHVVQAYTFPAFDKDGIVTRFTAPVSQIMTTKSIEALGCCSDNMEAKICSPEGGAPLFVMSDHKGPVLSVAICPQMKYASTSCGDGFMRVWDVDAQKIVKELNCVPKINSFYSAKVLCRMDFEPSEGKFLAYPNYREIIILDTESWGQRMAFTHNLIKCAISQCKFSPCGQYLAGSTVAGQIAVWEVQSGDCIGIIEHPTSHNVCAMAWNPKGNGVLSYCDVAGQLGSLLNCYGKDTNVNGHDDIETVERMDDNDGLVDELINYASDDDGSISIERIRDETLRGSASPSPARSGRGSPRSPAPRAAPQPPFQPSATPEHLEHRYMCWNDVGIVRCHATAGGESVIDVEFHDAAVHAGMHLNNYLRHCMAGLSAAALALACETPSKLVVISLVGSSKEWSVSMPETEEVRGVAAAGALVACATSARLLRLYTCMGTQRQVISLAGDAVCLAGYHSTLLAAYHAAAPGPADQHLALDIVAMNGQQLRSKTVPVPLSAGARLAWLGASDAGSPCVYDSAGVLRLLDVPAGVWLPLADLAAHAKGVSDSWFIVSVSEATQRVRAVLCRGASFPPTAPKPIVAELPLQVPLCELDTEKGQLEEQLLRAAAARAFADVKHTRELALKLFALACRSEIEQRALELMELLKDERLLPLAARYASRLGRVHLAEKLTDLAQGWEEPPAEPEREVQAGDVIEENDLNASLIIAPKIKEKPQMVPIKPMPLRASPGGRNPFRKSADARAAASPLSLTERALVLPPAADDDQPLTPTPGETFVDWFSRHRTTLEEQNPELTPAELTKLGVRTFKSVTPAPTPAAPAPAPGAKRKLDQESSERKQSKLSAFAFQKKNAVEE